MSSGWGTAGRSVESPSILDPSLLEASRVVTTQAPMWPEIPEGQAWRAHNTLGPRQLSGLACGHRGSRGQAGDS